jgi:Flp pilus assembly protein TadB
MGNLFPILRRMERGRKEKASEKISSQNKRKKQNHSSSTTGGCHCLQEQKDISVTQKNTLPSPSLSKRLKASLHSAICFSVSSCTILHYFFLLVLLLLLLLLLLFCLCVSLTWLSPHRQVVPTQTQNTLHQVQDRYNHKMPRKHRREKTG